MKTADYIIIQHKETDYKVNVKKLEIALSVLEGKRIEIKSNKQLEMLLNKYELYDDLFLKNINNI